MVAAGCRASAASGGSRALFFGAGVSGGGLRVETYNAFTSRMVRENPNVRRFNTHVTLSVLKRGLTIPIPLNDASTSPGAE
jgi:hypothetical protein